ncbi:hypothetical protein, partial [Flavobacterium sp.]|uniref:hypothetical protein n=1 Tax=Flavobacterium sp. TaxID=239 RepID=UPI0037C18C06
MKNTSIQIRPHKNWISIIALILMFFVIFFFLILYLILFIYNKMFIIIIPIFIMFVINFLIVKQFFLLFFGSLEIYFSINEISINSKFMSINKYKYYQLDEISDIWVDDSFVLKKINKIPLFGQIFFQLISSTNPDNKSIMIKYKGKVLNII